MDETGAVYAESAQQAKALQKQIERERTEFKETCQAMHEDMRQQDKIKKEMEIKANVLRKNVKGQRSYVVADEEDEFSEHVMYRRILKIAFLNCIQRRHIKQHTKNIDVFEQAFLTIKSSTGISDIEEIVKIFVKLEEKNYSLLTYVNQLNREIENFEMSNRSLDQQLTARKVYEEQGAKAKHGAHTDKKQQIKNTQKVTEEN